MEERPLQVLVSDRVRSGTGQWATRAKVQALCLKRPDFCLHPQPVNAEVGVSHKDFLKFAASVPFVACPHGGGMDPSPKAWETLLVGSIPIIFNTVLDDAYERLPVVFVSSWEDFFNVEDMGALLQSWVDQLHPYFQPGSELRRKTLDVSCPPIDCDMKFLTTVSFLAE